MAGPSYGVFGHVCVFFSASWHSPRYDSKRDAKRRRKAAYLGNYVGRENLHIAVTGAHLEAREHRFLGTGPSARRQV